MKPVFLPLALLLIVAASIDMCAADTVFSGPQPGEKTTSFKVLEMTGENAGKERDPIQENRGAPTAIVFVHGIERSLVPLLRAVDEYGSLRKSLLKTEVVFLAGDRLQGEQRVKAATGSLKLQSRVGLSTDGGEGPGNYGLNKECLMTIVAANDNRVTANFALVQPGVADAPRVIQALAKTCGDTNPPPVEQLTQRPMARSEAGAGRNPEMRGRNENPSANADDSAKPKERFPGAVPTDPTLNSLLRQMIRPTTEDAAADKLIEQMKAHVGKDAGLRQQAIDGWVRVLHFGDRYGTEHSRTIGREYMELLKQEAVKP